MNMIKEITPNQQRWERIITSMRFPLIFLVVYSHMLPFTPQEISWEFSARSIYVLLSEGISHTIADILVPFFFVFSGYLFFRNISVEPTVEYYTERWYKRIYSLLIPYILWNSLMLLAMLIVNYVKLKALQEPMGELPSIYDIYWGMPINYPQWYIRNLLVIVLFSPLYYYFCKYLRVWGVLLLFVAYQVLSIPIDGLSMTSIFYYGVGAYLSICHVDIISVCRKVKYPNYVLTLLLFLWLLYTHEGRLLFIPSAMITAINIFDTLVDKAWFWKLSTRYLYASFFIYGAHLIYIQPWLKGTLTRLPYADSPYVQIIGYLVTPFIVVAICILLYKVWEKISPRTLNFAIGGRS